MQPTKKIVIGMYHILMDVGYSENAQQKWISSINKK